MDEEEPGGLCESLEETKEVPRADDWDVHKRPVGEPQSFGVLTESLIIC